jgi:T5SS/PEP-CTERM-associated repeat protein
LLTAVTSTATFGVAAVIGNGNVGVLNVTGDGTSGSAMFSTLGSIVLGAGSPGGSGSINISSGGVVEATRNSTFSGSGISVGWTAGSTGSVVVDGVGSILSATDRIQVGGFENTTGTMVISDGGLVETKPDPLVNLNASNVLSEIGTGDNASGSVTVTGAGSTFKTSGLIVGNSAVGGAVVNQGSLTISDGGVVDINTVTGGKGGSVSVGSATGSQITVTGAGSRLQVEPVTSGFNAGKEILVGGFGAGTLLVDDFGAVEAAGANILVGGGFFGSNTDPGTLTVRNGGSVTANSVTVSQNGLLNGDGTVTGDVILNGGTIAPGNSPGTLTVDGDMTLTSGLLEIEISTTASDHFDVTGIVSLGSGLLINLIFLDQPLTGSVFDIEDFFSGFTNFLVDPLFDLASSANLAVTGLGRGLVSVSLGNQLVSFGREPNTVPAPATVALIVVGIAGIAAVRRRRRT